MLHKIDATKSYFIVLLKKTNEKKNMFALNVISFLFRCCEKTMGVMRSYQEALLTIVEVPQKLLRTQLVDFCLGNKCAQCLF